MKPGFSALLCLIVLTGPWVTRSWGQGSIPPQQASIRHIGHKGWSRVAQGTRRPVSSSPKVSTLPIHALPSDSIHMTGTSASQGGRGNVAPVRDESVTRESAGRRALAAVAVLIWSFLSTVMLVLYLRRRFEQKKPKPVPAGSVLPQGPADQSVLPVGVSDEAAQSAEAEVPSPVGPDSEKLRLAKRFGRGLGEINLSFDLKSRRGGEKSVRAARKVAGTAVVPRNTMKIAKQLGISKGEVDLAMIFHRTNSTHSLKREAT